MWTALPDDLYKTGTDPKQVAIEQDCQVREWAVRLGCSEQELREAMETVGNSVDEVRRFLRWPDHPGAPSVG